MKIIKYKVCVKANEGTEEETGTQPEFRTCTIECASASFPENYAIAEKEAYNGEITVEDDGQPDPASDPEVTSLYDELDAAYQEGYAEGYAEGVNTAYDQ